MVNILRCLLLAAPAASAVLPRISSNSKGSFGTVSKRAGLGAIDTSDPNAVAGGEVTCAAPPVNSFFAGLKAPVLLL